MFVSDHPITVDGVRLDTLGYGIEGAALTIGGLRSGDQVLAGMDGVVASLEDAREPSIYALSMFVNGCDEDGLVPADRNRWGMLRQNLDMLLALFARTDALLDVREVVVGDPVTQDVQNALDAPQRQAYAKVSDTLAPDLQPGAVARFTVALNFPSVFWQDVDAQVWAQAALVSGTTYAVPTLDGSSAPISDAVVCLTGPATSPVKVADANTGAFVRLNANVPAGQTWRVNTATWESRMGATLGPDSADTDGTDMAAATDSGGRYPSLLRLTPRPDAGTRRVKMAVTAAGMAAASTLTVSARRKFL